MQSLFSLDTLLAVFFVIALVAGMAVGAFVVWVGITDLQNSWSILSWWGDALLIAFGVGMAGYCFTQLYGYMRGPCL